MYAVPDIDKEETLGYSICEAPPIPPTSLLEDDGSIFQFEFKDYSALLQHL
jgi:hypothetical protein